MCDLNGPFKLCTCSEEIDYSKPYWMLRTKAVGEGQITSVVGLMSLEINLFQEIMDRKIERRLNRYNVFDFDYSPRENDQLFLHENEDEFIELRFENGKWRVIESLGSFRHFEFEKTLFGIIDSKSSELTRVYQEYQSKRDKDELDITICHSSGSARIAEKQLIALMKAKINGEDIELPEGYTPISF